MRLARFISEIRYWYSYRGFARLLALSIAVVGLLLIVSAAYGFFYLPEPKPTPAHSAMGAAIGIVCLVVGIAVLRIPRSRR